MSKKRYIYKQVVNSDPGIKSKGRTQCRQVTLLLDPKEFASVMNSSNITLLHIVHTEYLWILYNYHAERQLPSYKSFPYVSSL
jgi:hypothetical protein